MTSPALPARQVHVFVLIIMVNLALYLAQLFVHGGRELATGELIAWGANVAPLTMAGQPQRLFTSLFVHMGFLHLALNMVLLFTLGAHVERVFGALRFSLIYMVAGMFGGLLSAAWHAQQATQRMTVVMGEVVTTEHLQVVLSGGASVALMGIAGAALARSLMLGAAAHEAGSMNARSPVAQAMGFALVLVCTLPGADHPGHVGGLLAGALLGGVLALAGTGPRLRHAVPVTVACASVNMMALILQAEPTAGLLSLRAQLIAPGAPAAVSAGRLNAVAANGSAVTATLLRR